MNFIGEVYLQDLYSKQWLGIEEVFELKRNDIDIRGVGYTVYLGGEHERDMLAEAARLVLEAHVHGLFALLCVALLKGRYSFST